MDNCPNCGASVPPGGTRCAYCDAPMAGAVAPPGVDQAAPVPEAAAAPPPAAGAVGGAASGQQPAPQGSSGVSGVSGQAGGAPGFGGQAGGAPGFGAQAPGGHRPPDFAAPAHHHPGGPGPAMMGGAGPWGAPSPAPAVSPNFGLWIALGLAQLILCAGFLPAIAATILAFLSKADWDRGNYGGAVAKLRWAKVCTVVNIALGVVGGVLYVLLMMFAAMQG